MKEIIQVEDIFNINGRGLVYCFKCPQWLEEYSETNSIIGDIFQFNLNSIVVKSLVIGVERFGIARDKFLYENEPCGFLIKTIEQ